MVRIRTVNDLILNALDFYRTAQPDADLKPGGVTRDIVVDGPSVQLARFYEEIAGMSNSQSLYQSLGSDVDALAQNYGAARKGGAKATGTAILTFSSVEADIPIEAGSVISANNGVTFTINNSFTVGVANKNIYKSTASKYQAALGFSNITDLYAVEAQVTASISGTAGNISKYTLNTASIPGVSNVTNADAFGGGSDAESDSSFKSRILGIFSGANTGTATGYKQIVQADPDVIDTFLVGPGDTLMTRDGTVVNVAEDGTRTIVSEGTGGKVDIYTYGFRFTQALDSYIYFDKSNKNDPTNIANDFVLGQISGDAGKTVTKKRNDDLASGTVPNQPVNNIISVSGSISGSNFKAKTTDSNGVVSGNFELVPDTGVYAGSPWGFDKLHWIDNQVRNFRDDQTKGRFNSMDGTGFSDVTHISTIQQDILVTNENSKISQSDRTSIYLAHTPIKAVSRVFNQTTGERYVVTSQNPDNTGDTNTSGRITISGNTLPATSDVLQVDYTWNYRYDPNFDFDNRLTSSNPRSVVDSIDWGYSNAVRREEQIVASDKTVTVTHPVNSVISVNSFATAISSVTELGGRLACILPSGSALPVTNVISIVRTIMAGGASGDSAELYDTFNDDGSFTGSTIYLPTDTVAEFGDGITIRYNANNLYVSGDVSGSFNDVVISLPSTTTATTGTIVECNYISDVSRLLPPISLFASTPTVSALPVVSNGNSFKNNISDTIGLQPFTNIYSGTTIMRNLREAPSRLRMLISGSISPGVITVSGTTILGVFDGIFVANATGLTQDLSSLIRGALGIQSTQSIPSNVRVARIISCNKVITNDNLQFLSLINSFDIKDYKLKNNDFVKKDALVDTRLSSTQFTLPNTNSNKTNAPVLGDRLQITFYIVKVPDSSHPMGDVESISFSKSGTLYTDKSFVLVDSIAISSGFTSAESQYATLTIFAQNQPTQGSRYAPYYDYIAPKPNERITITFNVNSIITDNTFAIENSRPIGADVLVKAASPLDIDTTLAIVVTKGLENTSATIAQNVKDAITSLLNASSLGTILDESDLINQAYTVSGVDRVRSLQFNQTGLTGRVLSIIAQSNQYIQANNVQITVETR